MDILTFKGLGFGYTYQMLYVRLCFDGCMNGEADSVCVQLKSFVNDSF